MTVGDFFGEKALLSGDIRSVSCVANSHVQCLTLGRDEFVRLLGNIQELLDVNNVRADMVNMVTAIRKYNVKIQ